MDTRKSVRSKIIFVRDLYVPILERRVANARMLKIAERVSSSNATREGHYRGIAAADRPALKAPAHTLPPAHARHSHKATGLRWPPAHTVPSAHSARIG